MAHKEKAFMFDAQDKPLEAAQAYEKAVAESDANVDLYRIINWVQM